MSAPPPSYDETMQRNQGYPPGQYQPNYGAFQQPGVVYPPQGSYTQPPAGAYDPSKHSVPPYPPQAGYPQSPYQQQTNIVVQHHPSHSQSVVVVGGCPACRVGILEDDFTCLGVLCAILFFPLGLICCLAMRQRRCASCGAVFG